MECEGCGRVSDDWDVEIVVFVRTRRMAEVEVGKNKIGNDVEIEKNKFKERIEVLNKRLEGYEKRMCEEVI